MSHPSLGLPPHDQAIAHPGVGDRLRTNVAALGIRALEIAVDRDPTITDRHGELELRHLLRDTQILIERIALAVDRDDPSVAGEFMEWVSPIYRRRKVPLDDIVGLCEGLRGAMGGSLSATDLPPANAAIDEAIRVLRWNRRIAGDARKKNRLLQAIYKGA